MSAEQVLFQPRLDFGEREELDSFAVLDHDVVDQFDQLIVADPLVGMETERCDAAFDGLAR